MSEERFHRAKTDLSNKTQKLIEAVQQPESDILRDAVIQRFEFSFELVWKTLKLYLERQGHECGGFRPTLKKAFTEGLITRGHNSLSGSVVGIASAGLKKRE